MAPKLYYFLPSPAARGPLFVARNLNIDLDLKTVDLTKQEQHQDWYKKINIQESVPALDDNGFIVNESRAISAYLVNSRSYGHSLYPTDPKARALVDARLYFDATSVFPRVGNIVGTVMFGGATEITEEQKKNINTTVNLLNQYLTGKKWVAGDQLTIADLHICCSVANLVAFELSLNKYPEVERWYNQCKELPGFGENEKGAKILGGLVTKNLKPGGGF